jgi:serine/threonine protein kinase
MQYSVESICNALARNRLAAPQTIRALRQQWLHEAGPSGPDAYLFGKWLVARKVVTDFQAAVLLGRSTERLQLGPYTMVSRIVKRRLAGVYKAVHAQGQVVAVKVLPPAKADDPEVLGRFKREARLAVRLQHPNVLRTFQAGKDDGVHFLVMEYLEGETLKDICQRRGRLPLAEAARLVYQALEGLQHIHEQGLVHRDLEPGNLMLVAAGSGAQEDTTLPCTVKILDIGLGRALFDEGAPGAGTPNFVTATGEVLGTPEYSSPEQSRDPRQVDVRSDIYSLGCVFYHALVGDPPFTDKNPVSLGLRHAQEQPSPLRSFNLAVPPGVQEVLDGMLAKDPATRYSTPERVARDLRAFVR